MHNVFISLPHSLPSITNTSISAYPSIESAYKVTVVDLDKALSRKQRTATKQALTIKLSTSLIVVLTFMSSKAKYTHRTRC